MTEFNEITPEIVEALKAIVGEANCQTGDEIGEDYTRDEMPIYGSGKPEVVVWPASTEEVSQIDENLQRAHDSRDRTRRRHGSGRR